MFIQIPNAHHARTSQPMNALILIVEDEGEIAAILEAYFAREGFRTFRLQ